MAEGRDFGLLAANGPAGSGPVLVPTHFVFDADAGARPQLLRRNALCTTE